MSTKPTDLTPWADDASYPADAAPEASTPTKVAYTLGQETVGYRPDGNPIAQEDNTWRHRVGLWVQYLNDGIMSGDWTFGGAVDMETLHVNNGAVIDDTLQVNSDVDMSNGTVDLGHLSPDYPVTVKGSLVIGLDTTIAVDHGIIVDGRNNRATIHGSNAASLLSMNVSLDDRSIDNTFNAVGTLAVSLDANQVKRTFSVNGGAFMARTDLQPGDELIAVTVAYDGPVPTGTWPTIKYRYFNGQIGLAADVAMVTDNTAPNQYREGGPAQGAGRTFQRYKFASGHWTVPNGLVNSTTVWQVAGFSSIYVFSNQIGMDVFQISLEYARRAVPGDNL